MPLRCPGLPQVPTVDERADELIDRIYDAALHPEGWQAVAEGFSAIFGGSPVNIGMLIDCGPESRPRYTVGLDPNEMGGFLEHLVQDVPWSRGVFLRGADRFMELSEDLGHVDLSSTPLYTEWMKPHGLAPIWPAGHMLLGEDKQPLGGFTIFRREGEGPFTEAEFAEADRYVPHLRRATRILSRLQGARRERLALAEVVDRLPTGVLLLDSQRRVVVRNQTAQRIVDLDDGFGIDRNGPSAADARENATLQKLIADAMDAREGLEQASRGFTTIARPSGKREYALMVTPLLAPAKGAASTDVVVAVFVVDPEGGAPPVAEVLEDLYSLTHSEAEIVRRLAMGLSLEEAAQARGVSMNTARSHLKHAFAKTGTSRQGELVRLIIAGVGAIGDG
jgi:DNA-binding CsgD family transcriptional regulator